MSTFRGKPLEENTKSIKNIDINEDKVPVRARLQRIDAHTWIDLSKVIGVEINEKKRRDKYYWEVVFGFEASDTLNNADYEGYNTSLIGAHCEIEFKTYDEANDFVRHLGIELEQDPRFVFTDRSYEYNGRVYDYKKVSQDDI